MNLDQQQRLPDVCVLRACGSLPTLMTGTLDVDVAIVGSGFSGALCALALRQLGRSVALIERGRHPRFAIGESTTPLTNLLLEELADRYELPHVRSFSKWGTWQRDATRCRRRPEARIHVPLSSVSARHSPTTDDHARQLLVAASPHDDVADTHWYRPDFDLALVETRSEAAQSTWTRRASRRSATTAPTSTLEGSGTASTSRSAPASSSTPAARAASSQRRSAPAARR